MPLVKLNNSVPIGLTLPIRNGGVGFFEQTFDTFTATKTNIINLLRTKTGERRFQPLFGCRLHNVVFEQNVELLKEIITNIIKEDISNWIQNVVVKDVDVKLLKNEETDNIDAYKIHIFVSFIVNGVNETGSVDIVVETNTI